MQTTGDWSTGRFVRSSHEKISFKFVHKRRNAVAETNLSWPGANSASSGPPLPRRTCRSQFDVCGTNNRGTAVDSRMRPASYGCSCEAKYSGVAVARFHMPAR